MRQERAALLLQCAAEIHRQDPVAMPRIQIDLPAALPFVTELPIYLSHINYANHLDNALLLTLVTEARQRFLASMGYDQLDVEGVGLVVADAAVQYRAEAFYGDTLKIEMGVQDVASKGCDLVWRATALADGREIARGKTGIVFYDYETRRVASVPEGFRRRFDTADATL